METKVIILGEEPKAEKQNPIEFFNVLLITGEIKETREKPNEFSTIELVCLHYSDKFDLMFAYNESSNRSDGVLFLGKFNDGVV